MHLPVSHSARRNDCSRSAIGELLGCCVGWDQRRFAAPAHQGCLCREVRVRFGVSNTSPWWAVARSELVPPYGKSTTARSLLRERDGYGLMGYFVNCIDRATHRTVEPRILGGFHRNGIEPTFVHKHSRDASHNMNHPKRMLRRRPM
jgi:hypothetical protein